MKYVMPDEPWAVRDEHFPWDAGGSEQLTFLLNFAVLAPSIYNTQPWLFKVTGSEIAMYLDRARVLPVCDPRGRNLVISCGAALYHLRIAFRHFGFEPVVRTFPSLDIPNLLAFVRFGEKREASLKEHRLFMAMRKRRTIRSRFLPVAVSADVLRQLEEAAAQEGGRLHIFRDPASQAGLIDLIREAYHLRSGDAPFQQELRRWTNAGWTRHPTGQTSYPAPPDGIAAAPAAKARRGLLRRHLSSWDEALQPDEPTLVVLATRGDNMPSWLSAGQALGRVLLTAGRYDVSAAFLNQPVGLDGLRERLRELVGDGSYPQVILRIGYGAPGDPTSRLTVRQVSLD